MVLTDEVFNAVCRDRLEGKSLAHHNLSSEQIEEIKKRLSIQSAFFKGTLMGTITPEQKAEYEKYFGDKTPEDIELTRGFEDYFNSLNGVDLDKKYGSPRD